MSLKSVNKYVIIFRYVEGKILGAIVSGPRVMDIYKEVRLKCFEMSAIDSSEIFGEEGTGE